MIKVIENKYYIDSLKLPFISVEIDQLISAIEDILECEEEFSLEIRQTGNKNITVLETIDDLKNHKAMIEVPLDVEFDGMNLDIGHSGCTIRFKSDHEHRAKKLYAQLSEFKPWYRYLTSNLAFPLYIFSVTGFLILSYRYFPENLSFGRNWYIYVPLAAMIATFSIFSHKFNRTKIYYRPRDTFWQRNSDKIWLALFSAIIGGTIMWLLS